MDFSYYNYENIFYCVAPSGTYCSPVIEECTNAG